nr:hypothetical protein [Solirubrobacterales bacterium]
MRRWVVAVLAALAVGLASACGDDDSSGGEAVAAPGSGQAAPAARWRTLRSSPLMRTEVA